MFLSREIDIKLCQNYTKSIILLRIVWTVGYYVTKTSANSSAVYWSRISRDNDTAMLLAEVIVTSYPTVQTIYTIWYNFDTVLYQFLETGTSDRRLIVQNLRFSGFSLYPLSFFLYSPFNNLFFNLVICFCGDWIYSRQHVRYPA